MSWTNTKEKFGNLTIVFHWLLAAGFAIQLYLVYRREFLLDADPFKLQYILWHKAIGFLLLIPALGMVAMRHMGQRPNMPAHMSWYEIVAARLTHSLLYLLVLGMPITGFLMSTFSGKAISLFGLVNVPLIFAINKPLASFFHECHELAQYAIWAVVGLHVAAALKHSLIDRDSVVKRMLPGHR